MHTNEISRRAALGVMAASPAGLSAEPAPASQRAPSYDDFALRGADSITEEEHFGIINGHVTVGVNYRHLGCFSGLCAPPFASSDFRLEMRLWGERVLTREYTWYPIEVREQGRIRQLEVTVEAVLAAGARAQIIAVTLRNTGGARLSVPVQWDLTGSFDYVKQWGFARPDTRKQTTASSAEGNRVVLENNAGAIVMASDPVGLEWEPCSSHWNAKARIEPGATRTFHFVIAAGGKRQAHEICSTILADAPAAIASARTHYAGEIRDLYSRIPVLHTPDTRLRKFYNRSALHFLLNRWRVPEFVLNPYYGTGSIKGGCVGNYLWNYGGPCKLFPVFDPRAAREHIKNFLAIDLTRHFLFNPVDGRGDGPWYPVNQEKIILSIYYYVAHTGDTGFLRETVNGKSVASLLVEHAYHKDDLGRPVALVDYGAGNNHLELRRRYRYDNYMPDLNGRRYQNYMLAWKLTGLAGPRVDTLRERALALAPLLKTELWSPRDRWFHFRFADSRRELRYTVQMYKLFGSGVLDAEQEQGLLSHLNEREFLSEHGLHSMSKLDPAYDQVDIDNGGGGICPAFVPRIAEMLYASGHSRQAEDLFRRVLWWGERVPYWADSMVANQIEYRKDTPLQNQFDATAGAQGIVFGMLGVDVQPSGEVSIDPHPPSFSPEIGITGLHLRGAALDITADKERFQVTRNGKSRTSRVGSPVRFDLTRP